MEPFVFGASCTYERCNGTMIGHGAFGTVYKAVIRQKGDYSGSDIVAVKEVHLHEMTSRGSLDSVESRGNGRLEKWKSLLRLKHPNVVAYYKINLVHTHRWKVEIMMDYMPDGDLDVFIKALTKSNQMLPLSAMVSFGLQMASGLLYLHQAGIIHADLKPANIVLKRTADWNYILKIADLDDRVTMQEHRVTTKISQRFYGTARYMSPEMVGVRLQSEVIPGRKTDVWSLGCILLDLVNCNYGFSEKWFHKGATNEKVETSDTSDFGILLKISNGFKPLVANIIRKDIAEIISGCLWEDPRQRVSAEGVLTALEYIKSNDEQQQNGLKSFPEPGQLVPPEKSYRLTSGLDDDLHSEDPIQYVQNIRLCTKAVLDLALEKPPCHGGIFLDNISYCYNDKPFDVDSNHTFVLGEKQNLRHLWSKWICERSANVAYIPPDGILTLPSSTGDIAKTDSWAIGCMVIQLLNYGKPIQLTRKRRSSLDFEIFQLQHSNILENLQNFYKDAGTEKGLHVGPEISVTFRIPYACEDFLARSLSPSPDTRLSLLELKTLPFVNTQISIRELFAMDRAYYETLPIIDNFSIRNVRNHPFLAGSQSLEISVVDMTRLDNKSGQMGKKSKDVAAEVWSFTLFDEKADTIRYTKAFSQLLGILATETNKKAAVRDGASTYTIRALQPGHQNLVHYFGCKFVSPANEVSMPRFLVFAEHCAGENFENAALWYLPVFIVRKWIGGVLHGLQFLHAHGIVHRNLSSTMIFFSGPKFRGTVKIGGFHNIQQLKNEITQNREISARAGADFRFVAPEFADDYSSDVNIGRKSDIWSVGCIALHLVTGQPPIYIGKDGQLIGAEVAALLHLNHSKRLPIMPYWVPSCVIDFVERCLKFSPNDRPTASDLCTSYPGSLFDTTGGEFLYNQYRVGEELPEEIVNFWKIDHQPRSC